MPRIGLHTGLRSRLSLSNYLLRMQFDKGRYFAAGGVAVSPASLTVVRAAPSVYTLDSSGNPVGPFTANQLRISDAGISGWAAETNIFQNSTAPATQTRTVTTATVYTLAVWGPGSVTASGAASGVATQGSPLTFTTSGTSLVLTAAGTVNFANCIQAQPYSQPPIVSAAANAAAAKDQISMSMTQFPWWASLQQFTLLAAFTPSTAAQTVSGTIWQIDDGTLNNRLTANFLNVGAGGQTGLTVQANAGVAHGFDPPLPYIIAPNRPQAIGFTVDYIAGTVGAVIADGVVGVSPLATFTNTSGTPIGLSTLRLAAMIAGATPLNGNLKEYAIIGDARQDRLAGRVAAML